MKKLQQQLKRLESLERSHLIGQIALKLERVLIDDILKGTKVNKRYMTLDLLQEAATNGDRKRHFKGIFSNEDER